ncbi:hypothetical protein Ocin01_00217 [Orchesella cincta]|uniref:Uncharacterized protein n=1 Tax=Orchesella cincta TaxID=48709 RepID=A0A1D2NMI3_ORCCI|nr:hypothetical protein Ocin01_00217 [Orchesella cincta]
MAEENEQLQLYKQDVFLNHPHPSWLCTLTLYNLYVKRKKRQQKGIKAKSQEHPER